MRVKEANRTEGHCGPAAKQPTKAQCHCALNEIMLTQGQLAIWTKVLEDMSFDLRKQRMHSLIS